MNLDQIQCTICLVGGDGRRWYLHGKESWGQPVRLLEGSLGQILSYQVKTTFRERSGQPGSIYRGSRPLARDLVLPVLVFGDSVNDWIANDSDFIRSIWGETELALEVTTEYSGTRTLRCRLAESPDLRNTVDPNSQMASEYQLVITAADPFFYSGTLTDEYRFDGLNWYGDGVTISNPGDCPVWPEWVITSPAKFILPDHSFQDDEHANRTLVLPFQPLGRETLVQTDPSQEMLVTNDNTQLWAEMEGQFFEHQIPPRTVDAFLPVSIDPLPNLPLVLPPGWREWIASEIAKWARTLGLEGIFSQTPQDLAAKIRQILLATPASWLNPLSEFLTGQLLTDFIADLIVQQYGSINNMAGATAQIRVTPRWSRPWGME